MNGSTSGWAGRWVDRRADRLMNWGRLADGHASERVG